MTMYMSLGALTDARPVALVTGDDGPVARTVARTLSQDHQVVVLAHGPATRQPAYESDVAVHDVRPEDARSTAELISRLPRLDLLVHGARPEVPTAARRARSWAARLEAELAGPSELTHQALPALRATRGLVVFLTPDPECSESWNREADRIAAHGLATLIDVLRQEEGAVRFCRVELGRFDPTAEPEILGTRRHGGVPGADPESVAHAVRMVVDAPPEIQICEMRVRRPADVMAPTSRAAERRAVALAR